MGILKGIIDRFRALGKSDKEVSDIIEAAANKATVNPDVAKTEKQEKLEIKVEMTAKVFIEEVLQTGVTMEQAKTAILKMSGSRNARNRKDTNNWRKMHGLPMRRKQKVRKRNGKRNGKRKRADCHRQNTIIS